MVSRARLPEMVTENEAIQQTHVKYRQIHIYAHCFLIYYSQNTFFSECKSVTKAEH
jgi:hypothetical protein